MALIINDRLGRSFKKLRISLTNSCNLSCVYCVSDEKKGEQQVASRVSVEKLIDIVRHIHQLSPLDTIRLTGGEPTLFQNLIPFIEALIAIGIKDIRMTTNGVLLKKFIPELKRLGVCRINISLDAVEEETFRKISKKNTLSTILDAIDESIAEGLSIKINTVIIKSINVDQLLPIFEYTKKRNISIRFLELMQMGPLYQQHSFKENFFSEKNLLELLAKHYTFSPLPRMPFSTTRYWITSDGYLFGSIANESVPFCKDCDRLRLDSYGNIYGCLSKNNPISLSEQYTQPVQLHSKLQEAMDDKQLTKFTGSNLPMITIGG